MAMVAQQDQFQARLKRISAGGENTMSQMYLGNGAQAKRVSRSQGDSAKVKLARKLRFLNAFMIGVISMIVGRLVMFHLVSDDGVYSEQVLGEVGVIFASTMGDFSIAAALALAAILMKRMLGQQAVLAVVAGFGVIMLGEPKLLQAAPDFYSALYSSTYVAEQLTTG